MDRLLTHKILSLQNIQSSSMKKKEIILITIGVLVATAATLLIFRLTKDDSTEKPPKGAPQLDIENPGSQHDFPKPQIESGIG